MIICTFYSNEQRDWLFSKEIGPPSASISTSREKYESKKKEGEEQEIQVQQPEKIFLL